MLNCGYLQSQIMSISPLKLVEILLTDTCAISSHHVRIPQKAPVKLSVEAAFAVNSKMSFRQ